LGATLVRKLLERGERVKAFVRPETDLSSLQGLPADRMLLSVGNIMAEGSVYRALTNVNRIYHTAANFKLWDKNPKSIIDPAEAGARRREDRRDEQRRGARHDSRRRDGRGSRAEPD
jgi:nucleoside-diphosphate-sugar epimerase